MPWVVDEVIRGIFDRAIFDPDIFGTAGSWDADDPGSTAWGNEVTPSGSWVVDPPEASAWS